MNIKFDENISVRLVDAVRCLESDPTVKIGSVLQEYGSGMADPDWMFRFRDEGGTAMISGDHNILQNPVNLAAYTASGLISIWPPSGWPELKRWGQAALLLRWWPLIKVRIARSSNGDRWRFDMRWSPSLDSFKQIRDPRIDS